MGQDAAVPSAGRQQAEHFVAGVVVVFDDPFGLPPTLLGIEVLHVRGATVIPGVDAASQDTLYGVPVEVAEYPGVHAEPPQPAEEEELLSSCLCDDVCVVSPGLFLTDVDPAEPEATDFLHYHPIDGDRGVFFFLSLPVVHNQLLCFADVEMEAVVLASRCQDSDLRNLCAQKAILGCLI